MSFELLTNSVVLAAGTTVLAGVVGLMAALWASAIESVWRKIFSLLTIVSLAMPPFLQANCWLDLMGTSGLLHRLLPLNIYSKGGAITILALLTWPIFFGFGLSAWNRIDAAQVETDPALRGVKLIRWLLWPMARASAGQAALLVFVLGLNNFTVPALLQVRVLPAQVWLQFETRLDALAAFVTSFPLLLAPLILLLLWRKEELSFPAERNLTARALRRQLTAPLFASGAIVTVALLLMSLALPMWQLIGSKRTWTELGKVTLAVTDVLQNSFFFPASAALICVIGGILIARFNVGRIFWLAFFVPGVLLGIALVTIFNRGLFDVFYRSVAIIVFAWSVRYVAIGWHTARHSFATLDRDVVDAATLDGARHWTLFRHIQWPNVAPKLALAWYVIYLLCLWDVETILLILPPGGETLAVRIFGLLHYGHNSQVNALCLLLLVLAVAPVLLWQIARSARMSRQRLGVRSASSDFHFLAALAFVYLASGCSKGQSPSLAHSRFFRSVEIIGHRGAGAGEFNKPRSLALDRNDNLYVVDMTGRVQKFSPDGHFLLSWQMPQTDLGKPKGMDRDAEGNIIVIEPHYQRVNHFSPDGKLVAQWGKSGTNRGELTLPRSVAVNSHGHIFISEYTRVDRVQCFSFPSAEMKGQSDQISLLLLGQPGAGPGEFNRAEGLGIDTQDRLYVADSCNHRIQIFSPDGKWLRTYGQPGKNLGQMSYPYDIRIDADGNQFVCEFGNSRIQIFDAQDHPLEILGGPGAEPGQFSNPWAIALDSGGNLYVADAGNHRVQKFLRR